MPALLKSKKPPTQSYEFSMVVAGLDSAARSFEDKLFEAGCSDALIGVVKGLVVLDFTRQASSFADALKSAMRDIRKAGGRVVRIEPDSYASLSDIAARTGLTRQSVSLLVQGKRGAGSFPPPVARVTSDSPLWDWLIVARWLTRHGKLKDTATVTNAEVTRRMNAVIERERVSSAA